ncbi:MAG: hypothetical protein GY894_01365 [Planctomycetes bacterium]|nr:hypothetical protein [Planctomycetota bacterium]MCP4837999.1 hypothetical protein [Planctomycetota bacterium]
MKNALTRTVTVISVITPILLAIETAQAEMVWGGWHHGDNQLEFWVGDTEVGPIESLWIAPAERMSGRNIQVSLAADASSGTQHMAVVWSDASGTPQSATLTLDGVVPGDWNPRMVSMSYQGIVTEAETGVIDLPGFIARMLINPSETNYARRTLFEVQEELTEQADPTEFLPGDTDNTFTVDANDILEVLTHYGTNCEGMIPCPGDGDASGMVNVEDLLAVVRNFGRALVAEDTAARRLLFWQPVGGSWHEEGFPNHIHPQVYTDEAGWQVNIDKRIGPVVDEIGAGSFDMWFHNIAGYWYDHDQVWPSGDTQSMLFEQLEKARQQRPGLVQDLPRLVEYLRRNKINYYAYLGLPRCWVSPWGAAGWTPQDEHGDPNTINRFYGELLQLGFSGIGHDAGKHVPEDSPWVQDVAPELHRRGAELFVEAIPTRSQAHFLGFSVVAEHRMWDRMPGNNPETYFTEEEIVAAGGRAIHIMTWPLGMAPGDDGYDPEFDYAQWRWDISMQLLSEGKTVAIGLRGMQNAGYPIGDLVAAAQN